MHGITQNKTLYIVLTLLVSLMLSACGGGSGNGTSDTTPPTAVITFPTLHSLTGGNTITVHGTAHDLETAVAQVRVNGINATSSNGFSQWQVEVPLNPGLNTLRVETVNADQAIDDNAASAIIESRVLIYEPYDMVIDPSNNNRGFVTDRAMDAVLSVDLTTGELTIISDNNTPNDTNPFRNPSKLALDAANARLLVTDTELDAIIAVDINTGTRTVFSDENIPDNTNSFQTLRDIKIDSVNNRALVLDAGLHALVAVNLSNGARTILSDSTMPNNTNSFNRPIDMVLDDTNGRVLVIDEGLDALLAVSLADGTRTIISNDSIMSFVTVRSAVSVL